PLESSLFRVLEEHLEIDSEINDIRDRATLRYSILDFQPDYIFHMAAQALVRDSYTIPVETFDTNVMGSVHLLDAVRQLKKPCKVIVITTDKVYVNKEIDYPYKEEDPLGGYDPYSASKASTEIAVGSYRLSFFNPDRIAEHRKSIATARAGNVIGGGDWAKDRIIPDLVRSIEKDNILTIRNPSAIRPWQHVLEPLFGYLTLAVKMTKDPVQFSDAYNFGPYTDDVLSVEELIKISTSYWGKGSYQIDRSKSNLHEAKRLQLDIGKAHQELGWEPILNSKKSIEWTIHWYKNYRKDPYQITEKQILQYLELKKKNKV
ncbi:MAG: CDP-glucose 4,6-dehydratase, partial [Melioribacteraceae bacterium]|nr:CDP-glucose 4,6-dehydratase [Melioribacteraceae bacterium]